MEANQDVAEMTQAEVKNENDVGRQVPIAEFIRDFRSGLIEAVRVQNPPVYDEHPDAHYEDLLEQLLRSPFEAQRAVIQAVTRRLVVGGAKSAVINGEMGTGKTLMGIATAWLLHHAGFPRALVVCPPHLVYKWRREIKQTVPGARVWVLNGPDTLRKLLQLRMALGDGKPTAPEFFVMGRVRMRMGFNWQPAFVKRRLLNIEDGAAPQIAACPDCLRPITSPDADGGEIPLSPIEATSKLDVRQTRCAGCGGALWSLMRPGAQPRSRRDVLAEALTQIPTIGAKTATKLLDTFGEDMLSGMLEDNVYEFINLMDERGELYFSDRQAKRMERAMANMEFSFGTGGYQPTEFIKRYLPRGYFGLLIGDEGHEFKNDGSAQGQAFGVLASQCRKALLLTGTLMGGYADDLFFLLFRLAPRMMIDEGFSYQRGSLGAASMAFLRAHGVVKDIYKSRSDGEERAHRTAKGKQITHREAKAPGFGPVGVMRFVLPMTAFLKLKDIGGNVMPPYQEYFTGVDMAPEQLAQYKRMASALRTELSQALRAGDQSLLGVVLNALLAWPDCCFRSETVMHPHRRLVLASAPALFDEATAMPKELKLLELCREAKRSGRRVLVYTVYTGTRDTTARLKSLLEAEGFKAAVLRASVEAAKREDWLLEQVDRGVDVIITNPELVKTGLDMLEFPTIVFMQSGYNVYTLQQASRRSWRIGQTLPVDVHYLGYEGCAQMECLRLMAQKIAVSQSTSGDMPDSGLDVLNQSGDSVEVALAKQLLS
jgi:SNF2 family DNA or RNA helicase